MAEEQKRLVVFASGPYPSCSTQHSTCYSSFIFHIICLVTAKAHPPMRPRIFERALAVCTVKVIIEL